MAEAKIAVQEPVKGRQHRATYATDKRKGGYIIRVEGPNANAFAGREVPVETKDHAEHVEKLVKLLWSGIDQETGKNVALYSFESRPRDMTQEVPF